MNLLAPGRATTMIGFRAVSYHFAALTLLLGALPAAAAPKLSTQESFRIGDAGVICTAQAKLVDPNMRSIFDRGYAVVCSDAAASVGKLFVLRAGAAKIPEILETIQQGLECRTAETAEIEGLPGVRVISCLSPEQIAFRTYVMPRGELLYIAQGLAGYDSAFRLGLRTLLADRPVPGEVQVAATEAGDPAAFARIQAGSLDAEGALAEAYVRNNNGNFAEAAEFFQRLSERGGSSAEGPQRSEYLTNQALQESNLGNFATADSLFAQAQRRVPQSDLVGRRMLRNFRAIHALNRKRPVAALAELDSPVGQAAVASDALLSQGIISPDLADTINREGSSLRQIGSIDDRLTPTERAELLDAQAAQLRGVALRQRGNYAAARVALQDAAQRFAAVRGGRVASTTFLRSQSVAELGLIDELMKDAPAAERDFAQAVHLIEAYYPESAAVLTAKARYAAYLGRAGQTDRALALYDEVVTKSQKLPGSAAAIRDLLGPYLALLVPRVNGNDDAARAMFAATQSLVRPGVAQTQAVFARELSAGNSEATMLFRRSLTQSREISRLQVQIAQLTALASEASVQATLDSARTRLATLEQTQTALLSQLADYPRYRVLAPATVGLGELQQNLKPGEAYLQMRMIGAEAYSLLIRPDRVQAARLDATPAQIDTMVKQLRASIVTTENGQTSTYPFDMVLARQLYVTLFAGLDAPLDKIDHLIVDPDGALLTLPLNLLVTDQASVDRYQARMKQANADEFDYTGTAWLGRDHNVTTAVSPRAFIDIRNIAPSRASHAYLGLGQNALPRPVVTPAVATITRDGDDCSWPLATWQQPISANELTALRSHFSAAQGLLLIGEAFTDSDLKARGDLDQFRIVHFATHGLVTAPHPQCPAHPALLTSFGPVGQSDGLLSFDEIFDLHLDADLVVLSACDTAGTASIAATREAGLTTGGDFALDGLVRAFVGAGARTVIASHWPVPDDFKATERLVLGLFQGPAGTTVGTAMRLAERKLMDDPNTSHPYYWSAFAIVGDGAENVVRSK